MKHSDLSLEQVRELVAKGFMLGPEVAQDLLDEIDSRLSRGGAQAAIAQATEARGYKTGWSADQFAVRQVAKLQEEMGELAESFFGLPRVDRCDFLGNLIYTIWATGKAARAAFDQRDVWQDVYITRDLSALKHELADCMVVLLNMANAVSEIDKQPFDLVEAAMDKARADVLRGVRHGNP